MFKDEMKYAPEQHYEDEELENRVYSEMATGDWWWEVQASANAQIFSHSHHNIHSPAVVVNFYVKSMGKWPKVTLNQWEPNFT